MNYDDFLTQKQISVRPSGLVDIPKLCPHLKPFQKAIVKWSLRQGRCAIFAATGLGKTLMQLEWSRIVAAYEQGPILLLSPLAVAEQTVQEAIKFGIPGVSYAASMRDISGDIVVSNYERFDKFDTAQFSGIVLDESSIIKSTDGVTRQILTERCSDIRWKLCCSATPAPNDYVELGSHAEFLDVMTHKEMLATFFIKDDASRMEGESQFRLKGHAIKPFWAWLASWAVMIRKPEDLGFDAPEYELPPLVYHRKIVESENEPSKGFFFPEEAKTLRERIQARRSTLEQRVAAVLEIIATAPDEPWLLWCNLNDEADALEKALPQALQVAGTHPIETKIERLLGFKTGNPQILVSKPTISGHGMNYQHCHNVVFVGLTDSFESTYQAIRRTWRFGQTELVHVYFIHADIEGNVISNLKRKERDFEQMLNAMSEHMIEHMKENVRKNKVDTNVYSPDKEMILPEWLNDTPM